MCIGEGGSDSLRPGEQAYLSEIAGQGLPAYDFMLRTNDDAMTWAVLEPARRSALTPRFIICRIDPCVMVMVEDQTGERRFCSMSSVEDAMSFIAESAGRALLAANNVHAAPEVAQ